MQLLAAKKGQNNHLPLSTALWAETERAFDLPNYTINTMAFQFPPIAAVA